MDNEKEETAKVLTRSRWQNDNGVPRYGKDEQKLLDVINVSTPGFYRGARIPKGK